MDSTLDTGFRTTRFEARPYDPPSCAPPYSSMIDDVHTQFAIFKHQEKCRNNALFPVRNQAGQHNPVNGELGRFALPNKQRLSVLGAELGAHPSQWCIPEVDEGALFAVSV